MTHRERFVNVLTGKPVDRMPLYFFGTWTETKERWRNEGCPFITTMGDAGPQLPGMDPDWEPGFWSCHGLVDTSPHPLMETKILEETDERILVRNGLGDVVLESKAGSTISHTVSHGLQPTRESWKEYKKCLDPTTPGRYAPDLAEKAAELNAQDRPLVFMGGSLYGWPRAFLGVETLSYLFYDDPELLEEIISHITDFFMAVMEPVLKLVQFDMVYLWEDCCGANGPLFSPNVYDKLFHPYYKKLIDFYKSYGVKLVLLDSDGWSDLLVPYWRKSGVDIVFPIEVGEWGQTPDSLRTAFGRDLMLMGGVDKHCFAKGEDAIRAHLLSLKPIVDEGRYLPLPDHRVPPECSYEDFLTYIRVYHEIFNA